MHFEILVEDQSGQKALDVIVPKLIDVGHTFKIHPYKGIGRIPKKMNSNIDASKRVLLSQLPKLLSGYGRTFANYPDDYQASVILICDLDDKCLKDFRQELNKILNSCNLKPKTLFCLAIEEGEAWFLGDIPAIKKAYPRAKDAILNSYINDSICGTWECLADAIYPGGSPALISKGWQAIGTEKSVWSEKITPFMNVENNASPSFCYFRDKIRELAVQHTS
jgi:hypothetical protein